MDIKDLANAVENMDAIRGGASNVFQDIYNGGTFGASVAVGGGVNSPTSSHSEVFSSHLNDQRAEAVSRRTSITELLVKGSQNVAILAARRAKMRAM